jgi:hypothetical protein
MSTKKCEENKPDCSTAGMGFARTDKCKIAPENCCRPSRGFGNTDFGKNDEFTQKG